MTWLHKAAPDVIALLREYAQRVNLRAGDPYRALSAVTQGIDHGAEGRG